MTITAPPHLRPELPLSAILDEPAFGAVLLVPPPEHAAEVARARDAGFTLPIVVDLADPTPYLTPGDLLLITGLGLPLDAAEVSRYVAGIKARGVAGLVIGLEPVYAQTPPALIEACKSQSMPLIQLPPPIYFASVAAHVSRAQENERVRSLAAMVNTARVLTEAAVQQRPMHKMLTALAEQCGGWAVLRTGNETAATPSVPAGVEIEAALAELGHRLEQQPARGGAPTVFGTARTPSTTYELVALLARGPQQATGTHAPPPLLLFGKSPRLTAHDRTALLLATSLIGILAEAPVAQSIAVDQLLMHFLLDATTSAVTSYDRARVVQLLTSALNTQTDTALAVVAQRREDDRAPGSIADVAWMRRLLQSPLVEQRGNRLRGITSHPLNAQDLAMAHDLGWVLAISRERELAELPQAMHEAEEFARIAHHVGRHVEGSDPTALDRAWPFAALAGPGSAEAAAMLWLAPLEGVEYAQTRETLAAWLHHHGSWDRTARELGIHRNTVRRLIAAAGDQLGRDLDDPVERARLLLAFTAISTQR